MGFLIIIFVFMDCKMEYDSVGLSELGRSRSAYFVLGDTPLVGDI